MRAYSSYLFDFDGTVTASIPLWFDAISRALSTLEVHLSDEEIGQHLLCGWSTSRPDTLVHLGIVDAIVFSDLVNEHAHASGITQAQLHDNVHATLARLKEEGSARSLVTNNFKKGVETALIHHQLHDMFDRIITREMVATMKPDPQMVLMALGDALPSTAIMIGDTAHDIDAGRAAGVTTALYYPPANERFYSLSYIKSLRPDMIIRDFRELLEH